MGTIGEKRVRTTFNPSAKGSVDQIKHGTAELIDMVSEVDPPNGEYEVGEFKRLQSLAMTAYEEAAMWAVKAATLGK